MTPGLTLVWSEIEKMYFGKWNGISKKGTRLGWICIKRWDS
jgi:hypothetical protein